ncbi:MAG: ferredoxin [Candidatus Omnitrophica bacterium]|nr:ferredoxin [Candidatus Omnitrophota bacterium]
MKNRSLGPEQKALLDVARLMCLAARTAPKTKGIDNIVLKILKKPAFSKIIKEMERTATEENKSSFYRDAQNLKQSGLLILIGCRSNPMGITYCGFCGHNNCRELSKTKGICAFNSIDLGIAAGSAVSIACLHHADNRIMYSIGKAAIKKDLFKDKSIKQALGIPLSASGKNPFFDR